MHRQSPWLTLRMYLVIPVHDDQMSQPNVSKLVEQSLVTEILMKIEKALKHTLSSLAMSMIAGSDTVVWCHSPICLVSPLRGT